MCLLPYLCLFAFVASLFVRLFFMWKDKRHVHTGRVASCGSGGSPQCHSKRLEGAETRASGSSWMGEEAGDAFHRQKRRKEGSTYRCHFTGEETGAVQVSRSFSREHGTTRGGTGTACCAEPRNMDRGPSRDKKTQAREGGFMNRRVEQHRLYC